MASPAALLQRAAQGSGSNRGTGSNSVSGIISTLVPVVIIAAISIALFILLRKKFGKIYYPRSEQTILKESDKRTPHKDVGIFSWVSDLRSLPDDFVLQRNSLDGYLFLRFFKVLIIIAGAGCLITWPILFPVNATGGGGQSQLDVISFSNVNNPNRYYAHTFVAWIYLGFITLVVARERMYLIGLRQAYFLSAARSKRLPSRTVLFMGIPKDQRSESSIRQALGPDVQNVWIPTDCKDLEEIVKDRTKAHGKLEGAQVKLSKLSNKNRLKAENEAEKKGNAEENQRQDPLHWVDKKKRPTHKLKFLIGKKVDTIEWGQQELPKLNEEIRREQSKHTQGNAEVVGAAFVEFSSQGAAQRAYQQALHGSKKKAWKPRYIDVQPDEIIWKNLKESYLTRKIKLTVAAILVTLTILFWTPITAFVGALTNINYLTQQVPFLSFITKIPSVILGVVTGLLPTIILSVCVILFPILCRLLAKIAGEPTLSAVELKTQNWYMAFQVVQVFLITTFASGASAVAAQIVSTPSSAPGLLAKNLPKASNFYLSYFILYGLAQAAAQLLNIVPLLLFLVLGKFLDSTPRKMYNRWVSLAGIGWGSEYPKWTNLGVIAISYSCIAPLIMGFALIGFSLLYFAFRYKWLFILGNKIDMKGEAYLRALRHLMIGVYLSSICMIGLFAIGTSGNTAGTGPLVLMIIFLVAVIVFHVLSNKALDPLEQGLPLSHFSGKAQQHDQVGGPHHGSQDGMVQNGHGSSQVPNEKYVGHDLEANPSGSRSHPSGDVGSEEKTGNKLTQKVRPYIDRKFYEPNRQMNFELPEVNYEHSEAYHNPALVAKAPFVWLARDGCGVSKKMVSDNRAAGIASTDEFAWFDEKNKLHWDHDKVEEVTTMLEEKEVLTDGRKESLAVSQR
ncbi:Uu.00g143570.m01.CDS01 [Anthostomella pinea]|uniref:Uu.00g143570.m01.CDS01 n=1 Tax=Anthostomella pinea TaxID=933095 RepID=A0AAI8YJA0_9PEZI|nr:Uu.00g143570.m01.CDS01 [Anthostomella pinea]